MKLCNHVNVLHCYCCFCVQDQLWIVSPFMEKGSLLRILQVLQDTHHITEGLDVTEPLSSPLGTHHCCHSKAGGHRLALSSQLQSHSSVRFPLPLLSRDIKAGNILVDQSGTVCIADFGVARIIEGSMKRAHVRSFVGTPCWMAPEVMAHNDYNAAVVVSLPSHLGRRLVAGNHGARTVQGISALRALRHHGSHDAHLSGRPSLL